MNRREMIADFQHFLNTHKKEVKVYISELQSEWFEDDGWEENQMNCSECQYASRDMTDSPCKFCVDGERFVPSERKESEKSTS